MKNLKCIFLLGMLIILSTGIVMAVGNGTPFATMKDVNLEEENGVTVLETSGEEITQESDLYSGEISNQEELETEINEVVQTDKENNIMLWGKELDITGEAKDLIMAAGANITSKALGSYAFMAASQLDISGEVFKDTFAVGNEIQIDGSIGRDLYALGNTIAIDGNVARDVYIGGEELSIRGRIGGDIKFAGDSIYISSRSVIDGDLDLYANEITIEEGAVIEGTVTYQSSVESISIPQNIKTKINEVKTVEAPQENIFVEAVKSLLWWSVANFILFAVLRALFPKMFEKIKSIYTEDTVQKYCSSCGWGVLSIFVIPFLSVLCIFTLIGSTVGVIGLLLYTIGFMIATVIAGYAIANTIIDKDMNGLLKGLIGILMIEILRRLPVIGGLIAFIVNGIAFGTVIKLVKDSNTKKEEVIETEKTE